MTTPEQILNFWFHHVTDATVIVKNQPPFSLWFSKSDKFDEEIRNRFELDLVKAQAGDYREWENALSGYLALILLFDQFPRNMHRNTRKAFAADKAALALTLRLIGEEADYQFKLIERIFLYMPLQHAENLDIQKLSLQCFGQLVKDAKEKNSASTAYFEYNLDYARRHFEIMERFGRFPHRNKILERQNTREEESFLNQAGSSF